MSDISQVIKALCVDSSAPQAGEGAIDPGLMRSAFAAILDGGASDLETGALMAAAAAIESARAGVRYAELVLGLHDAIRERMVSLEMDEGSVATVVLPNYGDEGRSASLPLLALLLRRMGIRVLVHGAIETYGGLFNCGVLREFGVLPATTRSQAQRQLVEEGIALVPATLFSPGLAAMLSLRNRLGISTPAHYLANLLMPLQSGPKPCLHLLQAPGWLGASVENENLFQDARVLLLVSSAAQAVCDDCRPQIAFRDGDAPIGWRILFNEERVQAKMISSIEPAPAMGDPRAWAAWTKKQLAGKLAPPAPVVNMLASCLYACGYATDLNQGKAIAAVETNGLAAA
jgi:anthranilate phosphoribosyltransferase